MTCWVMDWRRPMLWRATLLALIGCGLMIAGAIASGGASSRVDWNALDLTTEQCDSLQSLDSQWKDIYAQLYPQIQADRKQLRQLINDPKVDDQQVIALQTRLQRNEQQLRSEATRIFIQKKNYLNQEQRQRLYQMMDEK